MPPRGDYRCRHLPLPFVLVITNRGLAGCCELRFALCVQAEKMIRKRARGSKDQEIDTIRRRLWQVISILPGQGYMRCDLEHRQAVPEQASTWQLRAWHRDTLLQVQAHSAVTCANCLRIPSWNIRRNVFPNWPRN